MLHKLFLCAIALSFSTIAFAEEQKPAQPQTEESKENQLIASSDNSKNDEEVAPTEEQKKPSILLATCGQGKCSPLLLENAKKSLEEDRKAKKANTDENTEEKAPNPNEEELLA